MLCSQALCQDSTSPDHYLYNTIRYGQCAPNESTVKHPPACKHARVIWTNYAEINATPKTLLWTSYSDFANINVFLPKAQLQHPANPNIHTAFVFGHI